MELTQLIEGMPVRVAWGDARGVRVHDVVEDSRQVKPGSLFIARPGLCADGRQYIAQAIGAGAVAILTDTDQVDPSRAHDPVLLVCDDVPLVSAQLAERFWGEPSSKLILIGITGTNGKTSVAHLCAHLLNSAGLRTGQIGTVLIDDGLKKTRSHMTTPPSAELSRALARMVANGCKACAMEVSSHAIDQCRVGALSFDIGVFTNLTGDHLDYHKTIEAYANTKRRLFDMLGEDGTAVLNVDDARSQQFACAQTVRCSAMHTDADWSIAITAHTLDGLGVRLVGPGCTIEATPPILGTHNAMNLLQAAAACDLVLKKQGITRSDRAEAIRNGLPSCTAPEGRLERVSSAHDDIHVFVDFAHTDDAIRSVLAGVRPLVLGGSQLRVVFGCGGHKDTSKRPRMGRVASEQADRVVLTSDNPRTEDPMAIINSALAGIEESRRHAVVCEPDRERAIAGAVARAGAGDVIIIAGKGHETEQEIPDGRGGVAFHPFDDRLFARAALRLRAASVRTRAGGP